MENIMFESKNYKGVRYKKLAEGDISYFVRFTKNGKQIQKKVGTKFGGWSEKLAFNEKIKLEHSEEEEYKNKSLKFEDVAIRFLELQKIHLAKKTFSTIKGRIAHLGSINHKMVEDITQKDLNDILIALNGKLANKTINQIITYAKAILKFAQTEYGAKIQSFENLKKLKVDDARERFLTIEEVAILKESLKDKPELLLFVNLALCTGARLMTILNIQKKDISLKNETIILRDFKNSSTYRGYFNDEVKILLSEKWDKLADDDKVIQKAKRLIDENLRELFNKLFNQNNPNNKHRVVIHTLRHTFASHLAIKGISIQIIQKLLNHKDIKMTMRYSHLMPDSGKEAVKNLWN